MCCGVLPCLPVKSAYNGNSLWRAAWKAATDAEGDLHDLFVSRDMRVMPYLVQRRLGGAELLRGNELVPGMLRSDRMAVQTYKKKAEMA